jgi:ferrous iron transport protein B
MHLAILVIYISGLGLKYVFQHDSAHHMLIIELPEYKQPSILLGFKSMIERAKDFIKNAATIIVLMNGFIWLTANFNFQFNAVESASESILYALSSPIAFLLIPLGFGFWGFAAAALTGFVAKEEVVGALAVIFVFSVTSDFDVVGVDSARQALMEVGGLTSISALSFLAFNLFTPPCFAAIGAMNTELKSKKWLIFAVGYQLMIGYLVSMLIFQIGTLITTQQLSSSWLVSLLVFISSLTFMVLVRQRVLRHG